MLKTCSWTEQLSNPEFKRKFDEMVARSQKKESSSIIFGAEVPEYEKMQSFLYAIKLNEEEMLLVLKAIAKLKEKINSDGFKGKILIISHDLDINDIDHRFKIVKINLEKDSSFLIEQIVSKMKD